ANGPIEDGVVGECPCRSWIIGVGSTGRAGRPIRRDGPVLSVAPVSLQCRSGRDGYIRSSPKGPGRSMRPGLTSDNVAVAGVATSPIRVAGAASTSLQESSGCRLSASCRRADHTNVGGPLV